MDAYFFLCFFKKMLVLLPKMVYYMFKSGGKWMKGGGFSQNEEVIVMFMGQYEHSIDAKGRTIIPAKCRAELGEEFVITVSPEKCLYLYPMSEWEELANKIKEQTKNKSSRIVERIFFANSSVLNLDKQGRALIPARLREYAGLKKDLVFIGMINHIEIWAKEEVDFVTDPEEFGDFEEALAEMGISL